MKWMSYTNGARPVLNAALGIRWSFKKDVMMMSGFRTDFNYRSSMEFSDDPVQNIQKGLELDVYHLTCGIITTIRGQELTTGLQYSFGRKSNQQQFINLSEPVEYNVIEKAPLQGVMQNNMNIMLNSLSLYFGAKLNFGTGKGNQEH